MGIGEQYHLLGLARFYVYVASSLYFKSAALSCIRYFGSRYTPNGHPPTAIQLELFRCWGLTPYVTKSEIRSCRL